MTTSTIKRQIKIIFQWSIILLTIIVLAICMRVFLFAVYSIPTPSMYPAIEPGDKVVVNKQIPGPRIIRNFRSLHKNEKPDIKRLRGFRTIRRNDVLIFNFFNADENCLDMDMNVLYVKRCVATPGDTFYIENGIYKVKNSAEILGCIEMQKQLATTDSSEIEPLLYSCFPYHEQFDWTIKNFGPIYLPKKDENLSLNASNALLYEKMIAYETGKKVTVRQGITYINDSLITEYTFQQNYYFMAGDHVFDSMDSRYWGLLPEDHIAGKVAFIWNTKDVNTGKIKWNRFLKAVK
ncbi:MAG: signal peptidase I [Dysgonamonadaceae bacterium]|jgi:signal peptidase I|nr:signal peptidase I [Dysgonamonadaceae bacterium]